MFTASVEVKNAQLLDAYEDYFKQAPEVVFKLTSDVVNEERDWILLRLREYPGPVVYPIQWKSERQRRAFFATKGFGHGIPYRRDPEKGGKAWSVQVVYEYGKITSVQVGNTNPVRRFVTGKDQQPFHRNTGWHDDALILAEAADRLADKIETALIRSAYAAGG